MSEPSMEIPKVKEKEIKMKGDPTTRQEEEEGSRRIYEIQMSWKGKPNVARDSKREGRRSVLY